LRWWLAVLLFGSAILNYVDRQALSLLAPTLQRALGIDEHGYANVVNLFLVAYTLAYVGAGPIVDRLGARWSLALFVGWWSLANMLTAFARSAASLGAVRFLLGLGEAGNWVAAPKTVARWFPAPERGLAIGLYTLGASIGATIAPFLVLHLASRWGWQGAFIVTGAFGFIWIAPWLWLAREPARNPFVRPEEHAALEATRAHGAAATGGTAPWTWREALTRSIVWRLLLARLLTDPVWYFYQFWFAKYLFTDRGVSQERLSSTWFIFLAADIGMLAGGWLSGRLMRRGAAPAAARLRAMLFAACLAPLSGSIPWLPSVPLVLTISAVAVLAHLAWLTNLGALVVDLVPEASLGRVFGLVAAGSSFGGICMNMAVAAMVGGLTPATSDLGLALQNLSHALLAGIQGQGYAAWFVVMIFLHPVAWLILRGDGSMAAMPVKIQGS
jgi:ACS family hexuronate transporter-like MFS transporter